MVERFADALPLPDQRAKFDVDDEVAYFNTATMSPMLRSVRAAGEVALTQRARPWSISARDWFEDVEELRARFARLIGAAAGDVALVPSSSYGLGVVARRMKASRGERVLVLAEEFPSNYYTWKRFTQRTGAELVEVRREPGQDWTDAILAAIDERVVIASIPNVHWTNGAWVDLDRVMVALRAIEAELVVDASQSLGAVQLDVRSLRPDAVVTVGYKWLLGPMSLGYLYLAPHLHQGEPLEENWISRAGADDFTRLIDYSDDYMPGARRFDVGQRSNFQLVPMALAAIEQVAEWSVPRIAATLRERTARIAGRAEALGLAVPPASARAPHMLGLELPFTAAAHAAAALIEANVHVSRRGSGLRIAPHLHNNHRDIDRLFEVLASAIR
jgi:selenocysteine lyase/cysteine desulfurase